MAPPTRKRQRWALRLSDAPIILATCLMFPAFWISWNNAFVEDANSNLQRSTGSTGWMPTTAVTSTATTVQPVSCVNLVEHSQHNATDTNQNRLFLRWTVDEPRFWISLHTRQYDPVRWATLDYGRYYEQIQSRSFVEILANSSAPRVIDVGGNIGWYSLLSAAMGAKVDVFEPNRVNYLRTCESVCINRWLDRTPSDTSSSSGHQDEDNGAGGPVGCTNMGSLNVQGSNRNGRINIFPVGVGSKEEVVLFETGVASANNPGMGSIITSKQQIAAANKKSSKYEKIRLVSLDTLASELGWYSQTVDILKIDVEGFELEVVRGAEAFLKSQRVQNIFMEGDVGSGLTQRNFKELVQAFADAGYMVFKIGGFSGPRHTDVPPMDGNIAETLTKACAGGERRRKKCNLWWKLAR